MSDPVSSIPNLGPATEGYFAKAGIHSAQEIRDMGADEAYRRWLGAGLPAHFIGYYALVMGLQGRPWNDCQGDEKKALRVRFDEIKASLIGTKEKGRSDLETALDFFGVRDRNDTRPLTSG
jgi:DNA transformation protein and related proteins